MAVSEAEVGSEETAQASVVEVRVATLRSPNAEDQKVHWELMEDGELVNMGEWQIPQDQQEAGPRAWEELILNLVPKAQS